MLSLFPNKSITKYTEWVLLRFSTFYYQFVSIGCNFRPEVCEQNTYLGKYEQ